MDIGTGKISTAIRGEVPHHLIDIADPDDDMTAARFLELADAAIAEIAGRGAPVIVAGGTMLYIRVLLRGLAAGPPGDPEIRARLEAEAAALEDGSAGLHRRLAEIDPAAAARIDPADLRRIVRALEVFELTGEPLSDHQRRHDFDAVPLRYPARVIGLAPADRAILYERINSRVEQMFEDGLVDEVCRLRAAGYGPELRSQQAIGYSEVHAHLDGQRDLPDCLRLIQRNSRRYARRQLSWYRRDAAVEWYDEPAAVDLDSAKRYLEGGRDA
jgi:tRNA dimethylallyltransferase